MALAGDRTLGHRLREEGPLHLDLLQRFGEDLLDAVVHLYERGINHRDIKPDNLGLARSAMSLHPDAVRLFRWPARRPTTFAPARGLSGSLPAAAQAEALGQNTPSARRGHDPVRNGDRHAAALGRWQDRSGPAERRSLAGCRAV